MKSKQNIKDTQFRGLTKEQLEVKLKDAKNNKDKKESKRIERELKANGYRNKQKRK